jgi:hypothetical protein
MDDLDLPCPAAQDLASTAALPPQAASIAAQDAAENLLARVAKARYTFIVLQLLDLFTTLAAFHFGAFEVNPLVARLTNEFGRVPGVILSKVAAVLIALGVRRRLWIINVFYAAVVIWNVYVLFALKAHH